MRRSRLPNLFLDVADCDSSGVEDLVRAFRPLSLRRSDVFPCRFSKQLQILNTVERNRSAKLGGNNKLGNSQRRIFSVSISLFGLGGELPKQYALTDSYLLYFCDYVDSATPVLYLEERATRRPVFQFRLSDIKSFAVRLPWSFRSLATY